MTARIRYDYPEGRDPLLADWRAGQRAIHPTWLDEAFWQDIARLAAAERAASKRHYATVKARKDAAA